MTHAILRHARGDIPDKYGVSLYLSNKFLACSIFTWYFGRRISFRFGILRKILSLNKCLSAKLTVRGAMSNLILSSLGHMGPSQISVLKIANVLLGVLPVLIDTSFNPSALFR